MPDESSCIFCAIVAGRIPAEVVHRGERVLAFRDLHPQAPTHALVISTSHYENVVDLAAHEPQALAELVEVAHAVARDQGDGEFRLVFNTGAGVGQSVFHVHAHVLAGRSFTWPPG